MRILKFHYAFSGGEKGAKVAVDNPSAIAPSMALIALDSFLSIFGLGEIRGLGDITYQVDVVTRGKTILLTPDGSESMVFPAEVPSQNFQSCRTPVKEAHVCAISRSYPFGEVRSLYPVSRLSLDGSHFRVYAHLLHLCEGTDSAAIRLCRRAACPRSF